MKNIQTTGHILAFLTAVVWGTTFVSTKYLLVAFSPIEILFLRFLIGFITLCLIYPYDLLHFNKKQEFYFAGAGLTGITLYYLLENIALTYTFASNVGIIVSVSPFFTALLASLFLVNEPLHKTFFIGFIFAITGIIIITFNNTSTFHLNPLGDILSIAASITWAVYSIITKRITLMNYNIIAATRKMFFYGLLFMLPIAYQQNISINFMLFTNHLYLFNILFLSIGASAICFITWNMAIARLGATNCSAYIYLIPIITIVTAFIFLNETITGSTIIGCFLTLFGLIISENRFSLKQKPKHHIIQKKT
ncbi:DMT family transporter [Pectinatus sottacetonis]|uniref:DMT family transporter n=1 Tax=Pectinatus sottacetonis TaxID=1002795 RepID=UPI0018C50692|nr:DMT family transporter [Pectinatus sottacetonis]